MQSNIPSIDILREVGKIKSYSICHFKEKSFEETAPAHHYVAFCLSSELLVCCCMITSQPTTVNIYRKRCPYVLNSVIELKRGTFPFCTEEISYLDCNDCRLFTLKDLQEKLVSNIGFKVKNIDIPEELIQTIREKILMSDLVRDDIKENLP
ncbi:MAG: hypothetical protein ACD_20C00169G0003 [uncultured bacterium]|nr:MAG: hypothetical protein ACD_20C00169G0003 [uncultured bacterium]